MNASQEKLFQRLNVAKEEIIDMNYRNGIIVSALAYFFFFVINSYTFT